ncbi:MAG: DUF3567 domain-containing protein [Piscinibacter sp.]|nr:DUF3567 domain-containing protein [Piscinibacter sp.]
MQMLYNSASFAVVQFEVPAPDAGAGGVSTAPPLSRGGYEIVDKFARKEIFIQGALAERFKADVQALIDNDPSEEDLDEYIAGFAALMQQPLVLH